MNGYEPRQAWKGATVIIFYVLELILGTTLFTITQTLMSEHYQVLARKYRPHNFSRVGRSSAYN